MEKGRESDPLWKDLSEKKQSFRRHVASLAVELKETRSLLASREQLFTTEAQSRLEAEKRAKKMEEEVHRLQKSVDERDAQFQASSSTVDKIFKDLDNLRSLVSATQASADASAAVAQSAQLQCLSLSTELDSKNSLLKEHEARVNRLSEQLSHLTNDLQAKEFFQKQLRDEIGRIENDLMQAVAKGGVSKESEVSNVLEELCARNLEKVNEILRERDEEIEKLRDEIRVMSAHWELKTEDLESQLEQHRRDDMELKKRVLKLEFCLHETRVQMRKLLRMGERRDRALKELKDELATKQSKVVTKEKQNFWETSGFKIVVSMSMLILVLFSRR